MTTLRDMPMITIEQKNRFREAALETEQDRDEAKRMLASACEYLSRVSVLVGAQDDEDPQTIVEMVEGVVLERDKLRNERDALAAECEAWSAMAVALANKYPVDSQTFDYMDEIRSTDWGECLAKRDARMKAEALEALNPHDLSRFAKSIGEDAWDMNPVGICKLVNRMATLHREQAEGGDQ